MTWTKYVVLCYAMLIYSEFNIIFHHSLHDKIIHYNADLFISKMYILIMSIFWHCINAMGMERVNENERFIVKNGIKWLYDWLSGSFMLKQKQAHFHPNRSINLWKKQKYLVRISKYSASLFTSKYGIRMTYDGEICKSPIP